MSLLRTIGFASLALGLAGSTSAATFTVTSTADTTAAGTLRWAIAQANGTPGADTIAFNIGGGGLRSIAVLTQLPAITEAVTVNGASQPGYAGTPLIELNGGGAPSGTRGLIVSASNVVIRALTVNRFLSQGIRIDGGSGSQVTDCWIGLNAAGNAASGNATGIFIESVSSNTIGPGNVVSGNTVDGVRLNGAAATGNVIRGNRIGTNPAGTAAIGNTLNGIVITAAVNNTVGGATAADANIVSGNGQNGIGIAQAASGNLVQRNLAGVDVTGTAAIANGADGVLIVDSPNNTIGGAVAGTFNVLSGNAGDGIEVRGATAGGNVIRRNIIGLNGAGTAAVANGGYGVHVEGGAQNTVIGDGDWASGLVNLIGGNGLYGIDVLSGSHGTRIEGNRIGTDVNGNVRIPNASGGIEVDRSDNVRIGGAGRGNLVSGNGWSGGIYSLGAANLTIEANLIGTNAAGSAALFNDGDGVRVMEASDRACSNAIVGGLWGTSGNLISGNGDPSFGFGTGISISNCTGAVVRGNRIGTNLAGTAAIPNASGGMSVASANVTIGGTDHTAWICDRQCNLISGNDAFGLVLYNPGVAVQGNFIGVRADGAAALGNAAGGIEANASLTIGGFAAGAGNLISGNESTFANGGFGVQARGQAGPATVTLVGNRIGTNAAGTGAVANEGAGVSAMYGNAALVLTGNVIAGNGTYGVEIDDFNATVAHAIRGNSIGVGATGACLGNAFTGVRIDRGSPSAAIGGAAPADGNTIACNGSGGVLLLGNSARYTVRNNRFRDNAFLAFDLAPGSTGGVTANDPGDVDTGPNLAQNFPELTTALTTGSSITIAGTLDSAASRAYALDFYFSPSCDPDGHGEAANVIGSATVTTNGSGDASFSLPFAVAVPVGQVITAQATDTVTGASSELSACLAATSPPQPGAIALSAATYSVGEGASTATVTVVRSGGTAGGVSVSWTTSNGSATSPADYTADSGSVTFAANETTKTFAVGINEDTRDEANETFTVALSSPTGGATLGSPSSATVTIVDNDNPPTVSVADRNCAEGDAGTSTCAFTISLSAASGLVVSGSWSTANGGATPATAGSDYVAVAGGAWSIAAGGTSTTVSVTVNGDTTEEPNETLLLNLSAPANGAASGNDLQATGTITDDDDPPIVSIADRSCTEGNAGSTACAFTIALGNASSSAVSGTWSTASGGATPATAGTDYTAAATTAWSIAAGSTSTTVSVSVLGDALDEANETLLVNLAGLVNAAASGNDLQATGTITDDDNAPTVTIADRSCTEGSTGSTACAFTISLSAASSFAVSGTWSTASGGATPATAGTDYTAVASTAWSVAAGSTSTTVSVGVLGDSLDEANETLLVNLAGLVNAAASGNDTQATGTITDDDAAPIVAIAGRSCTEGNSGSTACAFTIALEDPSGQVVSGTWTTAAGGAAPATAGSDYMAVTTPTAWSIAAGSTSTTVSLSVLGDTQDEPNETLLLNLAGLVNAAASGNVVTATGTITDDDAPAAGVLAFVGPATVTVGEVDGSVTLSVSRSGGSAGAVTIAYATVAQSASAGADYTTRSGTLSWPAGDATAKQIVVPLLDDTLVEPIERFSVIIDAPTGGAGLGTPDQVDVDIRDNELFRNGFE